MIRWPGARCQRRVPRSAAALIIDGETVAAAEKERFSRRKHGKQAVPFSTWELPTQSIDWVLRAAGLTAADVDAVGYSYDPSLAPDRDVVGGDWEGLRSVYAEWAGLFLGAAFGDLVAPVHHVPDHVAHAASAYLAGPWTQDTAVMVTDGRGERSSWLAGTCRNGRLTVDARQLLPASG